MPTDTGFIQSILGPIWKQQDQMQQEKARRKAEMLEMMRMQEAQKVHQAQMERWDEQAKRDQAKQAFDEQRYNDALARQAEEDRLAGIAAEEAKKAAPLKAIIDMMKAAPYDPGVAALTAQFLGQPEYAEALSQYSQTAKGRKWEDKEREMRMESDLRFENKRREKEMEESETKTGKPISERLRVAEKLGIQTAKDSSEEDPELAIDRKVIMEAVREARKVTPDDKEAVAAAYRMIKNDPEFSKYATSPVWDELAKITATDLLKRKTKDATTEKSTPTKKQDIKSEGKAGSKFGLLEDKFGSF